MNAISQFIVRVADLAEAEGRAAKRGIFNLVAALLVLISATALVLTALGFFLAALYLLLRDPMTPAGALAFIGLLLLVLAGLSLFAAVRFRDKKAVAR